MVASMYIVGIGALLWTTVAGYCAVRRSQRWNHFGHWCGVASVLWLSALALHRVPEQPQEMIVETPALNPVDAAAWNLVMANWKQRQGGTDERTTD